MYETKCPQCKAAMIRDEYEGVEIERCEKCGGLWITQPNLTMIIRRRIERFTPEVIAQARKMVRERKVPDTESARLLLCPDCGKKLPAFLYNYSSGIVLNRCAQGHGLFLDPGELELVQAHTELLEAAMDGLFSTYVENPAAVFDSPAKVENTALTAAEREAAAHWRETPPSVKERFLSWLDKLLD
ncbi:MAG TPA: zf-TFIIB domain-containing protein [bacterium]|nr:zf-TFIIB domain-containing protein [bacterium]